ncbi:MAG TPA: ORF6N domain-containing protein [Candidatus Competibacter sp.]|nr:ORF6N domain-containing protein [Candidatus Competibacter sp.]HUM93308.1 ORF6N domain-containing protein [Candidatus Competibacter sp.]
MSAQLIRITNEVEIPYLTYQGQPVVTLAQIDRVHSRPEGTAGRNFRVNKEHFIENEDYFALSQSDMEAIDEFRPSMNPKGILLITESGYLMLVKSFTDKLAWQIQRQLVKLYFRVKEMAHSTPRPALSVGQWQTLDSLIHFISLCCHFKSRASHAAHERIRFGYGLRQSRDLLPEHFEAVKADLEGLRELAEQHQSRMVALDEEFITAVIRPPVSVRKVRAMAKKQSPQPPLDF